MEVHVSVSQILNAILPYRFVDEKRKELGNRLHWAVQKHFGFDRTEYSMARRTVVNGVAVVVHGRADGLKFFETRAVIYEIKTGIYSLRFHWKTFKRAQIQLSAYKWMLEPHYDAVEAKIIVVSPRLKKYLDEFPDPDEAIEAYHKAEEHYPFRILPVRTVPFKPILESYISKSLIALLGVSG